MSLKNIRIFLFGNCCSVWKPKIYLHVREKNYTPNISLQLVSFPLEIIINNCLVMHGNKGNTSAKYGDGTTTSHFLCAPNIRSLEDRLDYALRIFIAGCSVTRTAFWLHSTAFPVIRKLWKVLSCSGLKKGKFMHYKAKNNPESRPRTV